jgi:HEPN domain-containing protein
MSEQRFGPDDPREWLRRAKGNLRLASASDPEVPFEELCYNAQQAAEKAIKAVLIRLGRPFPYTHNLKRLLDLIAEMMPVPADVLRASELTRFAFEARYPGVAPEITQEQRFQFLAIAESTVRWAEEIILAGDKEAGDS